MPEEIRELLGMLGVLLLGVGIALLAWDSGPPAPRFRP